MMNPEMPDALDAELFAFGGISTQFKAIVLAPLIFTQVSGQS